MPQATHTLEIPLSIEKVWGFVHDMNNWAPLVPDYMDHEILSDRQSTWSFKGDLGIVKKAVKLQIDITEWNEPSEVKFDLKGLSDKFNGSGHFIAEVIDENNTKMSGHLDITAEGMLGQVTNQVLGKLVPKTAKELTEAIAEKLLEINNLKV